MSIETLEKRRIITHHVENPKQSQGHYKEDNSDADEKKDVQNKNKFHSMEDQSESKQEFDQNANNKNKDTNTPDIDEHDVDVDCKEDKYLKEYNYEAQTINKYED